MGDFGEVETVHDWNSLLEACGCCPMPYCPVPELEAECKSNTNSDFLYWPYLVSGSGDLTLYETWTQTSFGTVENGEFFAYDPLLISDDTRRVWERWYVSAGIYLKYYSYMQFIMEDGSWRQNDSDSSTAGSISPSQRADQAGLLSQTRAAGWMCDLTTATTATFSSGRWDATSVSEAPTTEPTTPPWADGPMVYSAVGVWREGSGNNHTLSGPVTKSDFMGDVETALDSMSWGSCSSSGGSGSAWGDYNTSLWPTADDFLAEFGSLAPCPPPPGTSNRNTYVQFGKKKMRLRWLVPSTFLGSYFKITWDFVYFPNRYVVFSSGGDFEDGEFALENATWEWTGPGDPGDPASWQSPWFEYPELPSGYTSGAIYVRNIRYECYRSPYGSVPAVTGLPWTPPII